MLLVSKTTGFDTLIYQAPAEGSRFIVGATSMPRSATTQTRPRESLAQPIREGQPQGGAALKPNEIPPAEQEKVLDRLAQAIESAYANP
jgi:hypothetical protein